MVRHIVLWQIRDEFSPLKKERIRADIKESLEALRDIVPGVIRIRVITGPLLPTGNADLMLDSAFESVEAMRAYASHPAHLAVVDEKIRPWMLSRTCLDFEEE